MDKKYLQLALIGLDDLSTDRMEQAKKAVLKAVAMMKLYDGDFPKNADVKSELGDFSGFEESLVSELKGEGVLNIYNSLLAIDVINEINEFDYPVYHASEEEYSHIIEEFRAEILENPKDKESLFTLWLLRETGLSIHIFSKGEHEVLDKIIEEVSESDVEIKNLYNSTILDIFMKISVGVRKIKQTTLTMDIWKGIKFLIPPIDRRTYVFVASDEYFPNEKMRLDNVIKKLNEYDINHSIIREGKVPLIKVGNRYYELIPGARMVYKLNMHGVSFREYVG